jgi:hypothetical protein
VIDVSKTARLRPDPREYKSIRWFNINELTAVPDHSPMARERR